MSDKKNKNPYREGAYREIFGYWKKNQVTTIKALKEYAVKELGLTDKQAGFNVTVILSPRWKSDLGDCRGNMSAKGHLYYAEKLPRKVILGVKKEQKYRLRWRVNPLIPRISERVNITENKQEKAVKTVLDVENVIIKPIETTVANQE